MGKITIKELESLTANEAERSPILSPTEQILADGQNGDWTPLDLRQFRSILRSGVAGSFCETPAPVPPPT
jgi:hypothetical protein